MQKIKQFLSTSLNASLIAMLLAFGVIAMASVPVNAQADEICKGVGYVDNDPNKTECDASADGTVRKVVKLVINVFSWIVGIISVIMIIIGGLKYITSTGESSNINSAKNTILYAIIGLVVVALAQIIVLFVLGSVDSQTS